MNRIPRLRTILLGVALVLLLAAGVSTAYVRALASRPTDGAAPWQQTALAGVLVHSLALGHNHPSLAFAGTGKGVYRRVGGQSWKRVLSSGDVWSIALLPDDRTVIAADNDGYVDLSHDAGVRWRRISVAFQGVFAVTAQPNNTGHILAGGSSGIYLSTDGGRHWQQRLKLPGSAGAAFVWKPGSSRIVYAGAVAGQPSGSTDVYVSRDAGRTWQTFGRNVQGGGGIMSLAVASDHHLLAGTMGHGTWGVSGASGLWHKTADGMPAKEVHVATMAAVAGKRPMLFAGTLGFGVYRSADGGRRWAAFSDGLPASRNATIVLALAYDARSHTLYAGTGDGVYTLPLQ